MYQFTEVVIVVVYYYYHCCCCCKDDNDEDDDHIESVVGWCLKRKKCRGSHGKVWDEKNIPIQLL